MDVKTEKNQFAYFRIKHLNAIYISQLFFNKIVSVIDI